jgi:hypothetical protein
MSRTLGPPTMSPVEVFSCDIARPVPASHLLAASEPVCSPLFSSQLSASSVVVRVEVMEFAL